MSTSVSGQEIGLGGECVGMVTRVGENVAHDQSGPAVGEVVVALPPGGMGSSLVVESQWVLRPPPGFSAEDAVCGTMAYATAWLALHVQARVKPGMDVLIHSAAGGVGLAAVAVAYRVGKAISSCKIFQ